MVAAAVTLTTVAAAAWLIWLSRERAGDLGTGRLVFWLAWAGLAAWLWMVGFHAPVEKIQGPVQKIFYVHVPCVIPAYLGFLLAAIGGAGFLWSRDERWDELSVAGAEVGVVFCSLILLSGPLWAKPVWGHWWVWDLRLTATLILWFIYVAYLLLRSLSFGSDAARTFTSIYAIAGIAAVPFVYFAVDLARGDTLHPSNPAEEGLPAAMSQTLGMGMLAFLLVFAGLTRVRLRIAQLDRRALAAARGH